MTATPRSSRRTRGLVLIVLTAGCTATTTEDGFADAISVPLVTTAPPKPACELEPHAALLDISWLDLEERTGGMASRSLGPTVTRALLSNSQPEDALVTLRVHIDADGAQQERFVGQFEVAAESSVVVDVDVRPPDGIRLERLRYAARADLLADVRFSSGRAGGAAGQQPLYFHAENESFLTYDDTTLKATFAAGDLGRTSHSDPLPVQRSPSHLAVAKHGAEIERISLSTRASTEEIERSRRDTNPRTGEF